MKKTALVTGATSGIGKATAIKLARLNYRLVITGRRADRLEVLSKELDKLGAPNYLLCFDIRNRQATTDAIERLPEDFQKIDVLVNNAGLASTAEPIQSGDWNDWEA
ncbi:oxidoreductase [Geofilum rubicundum JCM 15548]|uniref:Oxidoreductase n=1 Tax=Geofilum rubicundum JCM 15548 TaxID=1236989 RepID=A0A0E9LWD2_9BACT|nr:SDR family NAD(P)-dependent oxidoreductase [Geofilum rubicundum]GAO29559.1 oxidoreductase [Geofilum rubicundum JCM 15548]